MKIALKSKELIKSLTNYSAIGTFLIMLIQILQEFVDFFYLKHLLILLGITELVLFYMIYACSFTIIKQSKNDYLSAFSILVENHNLFMINIAIPMVLFFDTSIVHFTTLIEANQNTVETIKKSAVLLAFLSLIVLRWGYRLCLGRQENPVPAKKRLLSDKIIYHSTISFSFFLNSLVCICIAVLLYGMKDDMELLRTICVFGCAFGLLISLFSVLNGHKKRRLHILVALTSAAFLFSIYGLYLDKGHQYYNFGDSVYFCENQTEDGRTETYYQFKEQKNWLSLMTCYEVTYDKSGNLNNYNVSTRGFLAYKWVRGLFTWYDYSKDENTMPAASLKTNEFPVDLTIVRKENEIIDENTTRMSKAMGGIAELAIIGDGYMKFKGDYFTKLEQLPPAIAILEQNL